MASKELKRKSQSDLHQHFGGKLKSNAKVSTEQDEEEYINMDITNLKAEKLANNLHKTTLKRVKLTYLTDDGESWYILIPKFLPSPHPSTISKSICKEELKTVACDDDQTSTLNNSPGIKTTFNEQWSLHPKERHALKIFGKLVKECRYSQSWGYSYKYSGSTNQARRLEESPFIQHLIQIANHAIDDGNPYNGCLQVYCMIFVYTLLYI